MTTYERMKAVFDHKNPDFVPIYDLYWDSTIARWKQEGMPADCDVTEYFELDKIVIIGPETIDLSPRFTKKIIEETNNYIIEQDEWGQTKKNFKPTSSTFFHMDQKVKDYESWKKARENMIPDPARINWEFLKENYSNWRKEGAWLQAFVWYGFDVVSTRMCNTETILMAMALEPEWTTEMFNVGCELGLQMLDMMWEAGYKFDELMWPDDITYKNGLFFSKEMWAEQLLPYQKKTVEWAKNHNVKVSLHCCGNVNPMLNELIDLGIDLLDPLEVKAGMNPIELKQQYGDVLAFSGGFDARFWTDPAQSRENLEAVLPVLMQNGGYVFKSDHSVPDSVSLEDYKRLVSMVREIGRY